MKHYLGIGLIAAFLLASPASILAQTDPFAGTWKLNVTKSKYDPGPSPRSQTRLWEPSGDGQMVSVESIDATGNRRTFGYWIKYDGIDHPITGTIVNGADSIATKHIDTYTLGATFKRNGKIIERATFAVSKDGKVVTVTAKGTTANGQAFSNVTVWDKQ